jgi:COX assembly protein 1
MKCVSEFCVLFLIALMIFSGIEFKVNLFIELKFVALRSKMKQKALKQCEELASKYAQCATGRTMSVVWRRKQAKELNECLHQL